MMVLGFSINGFAKSLRTVILLISTLYADLMNRIVESVEFFKENKKIGYQIYTVK